MLVSMGEGYENNYVLYSLLDMENSDMFLATIVEDWYCIYTDRMDYCKCWKI
jgi:hypothetical protein